GGQGSQAHDRFGRDFASNDRRRHRRGVPAGAGDRTYRGGVGEPEAENRPRYPLPRNAVGSWLRWKRALARGPRGGEARDRGEVVPVDFRAPRDKALRTLETERQPSARLAAARELRDLAAEQRGHSADFGPAVLRLLGDSDPEVRRVGLEAAA